VRRFSDAQMSADAVAGARASIARNYITLEALGRALVADERVVVLIDEIDKAQRDLPNDLLRELDRGEYDIPEIPEGDEGVGARAADGSLRRTMRRSTAAARPLIIVTSNVERQLPDAFLRRCIFYYVPFPEDRLVGILDSRFGAQHTQQHKEAASLFVHLRKQNLKKTPATAELIDWVGSLRAVFAADYAWPRLAAQAKALAGGGSVEWHGLDGLSALVKMREDHASLGLDPLALSRP
jgi:MoxR-like ATPase